MVSKIRILLVGIKTAASTPAAHDVQRTSFAQVVNRELNMVERYRPKAPETGDVETTSKKVRGRPFERGNPGRPPGSRNRTIRLLEQLMAGDAEQMVQKLVDLGKSGNLRAIQLVLDRVLPRRTGRPLEFALPDVNKVHDVVPAMAAITAGINSGVLTAEEAGQLMRVLEGYAKVFTAHDLATRLENVETLIRLNRHDAQ